MDPLLATPSVNIPAQTPLPAQGTQLPSAELQLLRSAAEGGGWGDGNIRIATRAAAAAVGQGAPDWEIPPRPGVIPGFRDRAVRPLPEQPRRALPAAESNNVTRAALRVLAVAHRHFVQFSIISFYHHVFFIALCITASRISAPSPAGGGTLGAQLGSTSWTDSTGVHLTLSES